MSFIHPLLLGGLVLVGIPVLLHLIMRQKPKKLPFPAIRFLAQRFRTNQRRLQLRHLLLLALRMFLLAAFCLALARPRIFSERFHFNADRPSAAVFLFDTSSSMDYTAAGLTRLDEAKRRAREILDGLDQGSRIAVLDTSAIGGEWSALSQARERIDNLEIKPANNPVTSQLASAFDLLAKLDPEGEKPDETPIRFLYIFSDRALACWNNGQVETLGRLRDRIKGQPMKGVFVDVGVDSPADLAIVNLEMPKQVLAANEPVIVRATVRATGMACDTEVICTLDDREPMGKKPVKLEAGQSTTVAFERRGLALAPGMHQVHATLGSTDALPFNNAAYATFKARGPRTVLTITDDPRNALIWTAALQIPETFSCQVKATDDPLVRGLGHGDLANYQAVCLLSVAKPTSDLWEKLQRYVAEGGGLAVVPGGEDTSPAAYQTDITHGLLPGSLTGLVADDGAGVRWNPDTYRHPVMASFREWGQRDDVDFLQMGLRPAAYRYWRVEASPASVVVAYDDTKHSPALLEPNFNRNTFKGRVLLFTTPLDDRHLQAPRRGAKAWNDYLKDSFFLVLVNKTMGYLAGDAEERNFNFPCGQAVPVPVPAAPRLPTYSLSGPGLAGADATLSRNDNESQLLVTRAVLPGNYKVAGSDGAPVAAFSVNVPPDESILDKVPAEQIETLLGSDALVAPDPKASMQDLLQGRWSQPLELLPALMILLLLALALENLLANKFYKKEEPATPRASA